MKCPVRCAWILIWQEALRQGGALSSPMLTTLAAPITAPVVTPVDPANSSLALETSLAGAQHLPQLMMLGCQKAATSSVWSALHQAGFGICGSTSKVANKLGGAVPEGEKEAHFFDLGEGKFPYTDMQNKYLSQFTQTSLPKWLHSGPKCLHCTRIRPRIS